MSQSAHTCNAEVSHRGNPLHSNAYVHRTTVHQTGQKTGQSLFQQAVSYSEIPLTSYTGHKSASRTFLTECHSTTELDCAAAKLTARYYRRQLGKLASPPAPTS